MGFTLPFQVWLRAPCGRRSRGLLDAVHGGEVGAPSTRGRRDVWERFLDGHGHWSRPWALYVAKTWGERHLAGMPAAVA